VPQVRPWAPVRRSTELAAQAQQPTVTVTEPSSANSTVRTPPPAYVPGSTPVSPKSKSLYGPTNLALPVNTQLKSMWEADTPMTPAAKASLPSPALDSPARTSSFAYQQMQHPPTGDVRRSSSSSTSSTSSEAPAKDPKRLPRSMTVAQTFSPSMSDELAIAVGEKLRMLEEYADGWCLVERGSERGVVPRFCLIERERRSTRGASVRSPPAPPVTLPQGKI
jgi:hypothetical protein